MSLNSYYKWSKTREIENTIEKIVTSSKEENYVSLLDNLSYEYGICIEMYDNFNKSYMSNNYNRGCNGDGNFELDNTKKNFILSGYYQKEYQLVNNRFKNNIIMYGVKLDSDSYLFVSTSLQPLDSTINILKEQFIIVSIIILLSSIFIAYFVSKKLSRPIEEINTKAKKLAEGKYDIIFNKKENIDEINELIDTLNYTKDELNKTENLRKELMANVSHDLKTPLTMIKAYAEMVRDLTYKDKNKREDNLNTIINETDRLNLLVNDILELSTIEANNKLNIESFDINKLLNNIVKSYDIYIIKDNYKIIYEGIDNLYIKADKSKLEQVIRNLINNALNYTGNDKKVIIKLINNKDDTLVEISDTGKGIKKEDIKYIWDRYYKEDKTYSRIQIGTGIGLSIVKAILEKHNFEYGVNTSNKGTTFYFKIKR